MLSNRLAFVTLGMACIVAAAGGGYLATRQNAAQAPATAPAPQASAPVQSAEPPAREAAKPVEPAPVAPANETPAPRPAAKREVRTVATPVAPKTPPRPAASARRDSAPAPERTLPSTTAAASAPIELPATPGRSEERAAMDAIRAEPPQKTFEELVVSADSVIGLQTETRVSSETARVEDRVEARVTRDVRVGDYVAIPAGARALGNVTFVERGGKFKERARLGIRFRELVLADGTRVPISTETIFRDGEAPGNTSAARMGGAAVGGAILGAILGGAKGAAIGATMGAGGGAAVVQAGERNAAVLPAGSPMTVRLLSSIAITTEK